MAKNTALTLSIELPNGSELDHLYQNYKQAYAELASFLMSARMSADLVAKSSYEEESPISGN